MTKYCSRPSAHSTRVAPYGASQKNDPGTPFRMVVLHTRGGPARVALPVPAAAGTSAPVRRLTAPVDAWATAGGAAAVRAATTRNARATACAVKVRTFIGS